MSQMLTSDGDANTLLTFRAVLDTVNKEKDIGRWQSEDNIRVYLTFRL